MLTYSYTFKKDGCSITADSGKPTRDEALADLREYVTEFHGAGYAPKVPADLRPERIIASAA